MSMVTHQKENSIPKLSLHFQKRRTDCFIQSLLGYEKLLNNNEKTALLRIKQKEALTLLLEYDNSLKNTLFDFSRSHIK